MKVLFELLASFDPDRPNFRPTEIYDENWLVKLAVHQASTLRDRDFPLGFLPASTWFSEALLPTKFKARYRGDSLAETRTNADCVIGHILIGERGKADLKLMDAPKQFTVVEAKMGSRLSPGTTKAPSFDQAARNVACMAETMAQADVDPAVLSRLDFVVLAPHDAIAKGSFSGPLEKSSIVKKVKNRTSAYGGELDAWFEDRFLPTLEHLQLHCVSWEEVINWIAGEKPAAAEELAQFYARCLAFN